MVVRLFSLLALAAVLSAPVIAKDKKNSALPDYVLQARTVFVVIDPDAGEPLGQPNANAIARESVEKALLEWGRFELVPEGEQSDLIITVRTGNARAVRPTIKGGPIDQRPGIGQSTDDSIRVGGQQGHPPPLSDPANAPQGNRPRISNEVGPTEDVFAVYRGGSTDPLDSPPVWRYIAKDCLGAPSVAAVEEFRKAIAKAEKPQPPKKP